MVKKIGILIVICFLFVGCANNNLGKIIQTKFYNKVGNIYLVNNWVVNRDNNLCKIIADSFQFNHKNSGQKLFYNDDVVWADLVEVRRRNDLFLMLGENTKKYLKEINENNVDLIIQIQPWYFQRRDAFEGQAPFPALLSYDYADVEVYNAKNNKLLSSFTIQDATTNRNYLTTEQYFGKSIYQYLQANFVFP
jgi:hypothetical protein